MHQDEEQNKKVDEIALRLAELFVMAIDENCINSKLVKRDNEK